MSPVLFPPKRPMFLPRMPLRTVSGPLSVHSDNHGFEISEGRFVVEFLVELVHSWFELSAMPT